MNVGPSLLGGCEPRVYKGCLLLPPGLCTFCTSVSPHSLYVSLSTKSYLTSYRNNRIMLEQTGLRSRLDLRVARLWACRIHGRSCRIRMLPHSQPHLLQTAQIRYSLALRLTASFDQQLQSSSFYYREGISHDSAERDSLPK